MAKQQSAPRFLNLLAIRLPVGGLASIAHRISGVLLFLAVPPAVGLFGLSLQGPAGFAAAAQWLSNPLVRWVVWLLVWALAHHLLAGVRHLLLDMDIGVTRPAARRSAWLVNLGGLALALWFGLASGLLDGVLPA